MSGEFLTTHFYENKTLLIRDDTLDTALVEGIEMELGKLKRLLQRTTEVFFLLVVFFSNSAFSDSTCSNQTTAGYQVIYARQHFFLWVIAIYVCGLTAYQVGVHLYTQ